MPGGVPSSFQLNDPWPVYIERGKGALVWDVDGNEYVDFHNGFGVMCIGHANPVIGEAVKARARRGHPLRRAHRAARSRSPRSWSSASACRSGASRTPGTESTMAAIHLARGATDRDLIIKVEGSYDGHHDAVMVSCYPDARRARRRATSPTSVPFGAGYPQALVELTRAGPVQRRRRRSRACSRSTRARSPG